MTLAEQKKYPFAPISVAQINAALAAYPNNQTIAAGLNELKTLTLAGIADAKDCVQCQAAGIIDNDTTICPLCRGNTKTQGQWAPDYGQLKGYKQL